MNQPTAATIHATAVRKRAFRLKLVNLKRERWAGMPDRAIGGWARTPQDENRYERRGLLDQHFGERCNYGALFTYLFRRFGLPNMPSDDYKEIAAYSLSTPLRDLVLIVSPSVGDWPRLSFKFLVSEDSWHRIEIEPREHWQRNLAGWVERQGSLPVWMQEWLEFWRTKPGVAERTTGDLSEWWLSITDMNFVQFSLKNGTASDTIPAEQMIMLENVAAFVNRIQSDFEAIEPHPAHRKRAADWRSWTDDDPLKPYYAAAAVALEDLSTPVCVRDSQINAHGLVDDNSPLAKKILDQPAVAGIAFGHYVNREPEAAARLLIKAAKLGKGSLAKASDTLFPCSDGGG